MPIKKEEFKAHDESTATASSTVASNNSNVLGAEVKESNGHVNTTQNDAPVKTD